MTDVDPDEHARRLAARSLARDDPTGWFERLYTGADGGAVVVPWDRGGPHGMLVEWAEARAPQGRGRRALVVGCGLGDDAEYVSGLGFDTTAFDVSPTAVRLARRRFPDSTVHYLTADLLDPPRRWRRAFDLVVEVYTVQSMPERVRRRAVGNVADLVAPQGTLVVVAAARPDGTAPADGPPWPLTRAEVEAFAGDDLRPVRVEEVPKPDAPAARRWRAEFRRDAAAGAPTGEPAGQGPS